LEVGNKKFEFSPKGGGVIVTNNVSHDLILSHTKGHYPSAA
jgi:hypothetical protein